MGFSCLLPGFYTSVVHVESEGVHGVQLFVTRVLHFSGTCTIRGCVLGSVVCYQGSTLQWYM